MGMRRTRWTTHTVWLAVLPALFLGLVMLAPLGRLAMEARAAATWDMVADLWRDDYLRWQKILHARGWGAPSWPQAHGGPGWNAAYRHIFDEECAAGGEGCREILDSLVPGIPGARHPRDLSEGQRLALALALVLAPRPPVVLLDEPTRGLDYTAKQALARTLRGLAADGRAVLVSTHDVEFAALVADRVVVMAEGEVVSSGPVRRVLAESPAFAPQVMKVLGPGWLRVEEVG